MPGFKVQLIEFLGIYVHICMHKNICHEYDQYSIFVHICLHTCIDRHLQELIQLQNTILTIQILTA